mmetsp:Transcript_8145/g.20031  ORF Transcript_8145/g.20031 Transcript_8145/m.20031 type:complete len:889 (+) Transcript_8145:387-3053(+)
MGTFDDDSSGEGTGGTKESSKSSKKSRRTKEDSDNFNGSTVNTSGGKTRKKKSKRKSNLGSETGDKGKKRSGGKKRSSSKTKKATVVADGDADVDRPIQDSMLVAIKTKQTLNGSGSSKRLERDVSFSRSTIARDIGHQSEMDIAMGKIPKPAAVAAAQDDNTMAAMGKIVQLPPDIIGSDSNDDCGDNASRMRGSAIKPSRFAPKKFHASLSDEQETGAATERLGRKGKPRFMPVDYGSSDDDHDIMPRKVTNRKFSTDNLHDSLTNSRLGNQTKIENGMGRPSNDLNRQPSWQPEGVNRRPSDDLDRPPSWQPEGINTGRQKSQPGRTLRKVPSLRSDGGDSNLRSSLTRNRPGIQRRNSMLSRRRSSNDLFPDDMINSGGGNGTAGFGDEERDSSSGRSTLIRAVQSASVMNNHKQMRRINMSAEHQTYIPPKSRDPGVLRAMNHALSGSVVELTLWTYTASFSKVMLFFLLFYVVNIFIWAAVLEGVDLATGGQCIHEDPEGMSGWDRYEFLVELSWATFTTVGYGTISPQGDITGCYVIRLMCALIAFVGVLFASQTAAIMYSKLMRLLAKAHVTFSSTLCVQYGKGNEGSTVRFGQLNFRASVAPAALMGFNADDLLDDDGKAESPAGSEDGFPIIEFRMINDRANYEGSEIWDAQVRGIVQLHKEQPSDGGGAHSSLTRDKAAGGESTLDLEKKVYYPITLSPDTHPHFSRIWYARHTLNAESPLLKREYRDMIVKDGGKWDKDFNNWEEIRQSLNPFISLRITLSGTSAVSASTVYGEHVYEFDDVCVGWRFANMVYEKKERVYRNYWRSFGLGRALREDEKENHETPDMRTKIDADLLHDILPQPGGDFEPLDETKHSGMKPKNLFLKVVTLGMYGEIV